ncbi:MAG: uroporphyrinogen decarboxylase family protein [Anaerolineales bacterium]
MRKNVTHRQRIETCLSGGVEDGVPVALWRHFPVDDQRPETLAKAHLDFQSAYDFDLLKVTPASSYMAKDWGVRDEWRGATEGTREYTRRVIGSPDDWNTLPVLDPHRGSLGDTLQALKAITQELGGNTPVIQTIFSPLSQAKNVVGRENLVLHLRQHPEALHAGLRTIAESTARYVDAVRSTGVAGIFYAVQHAQYGILSPQEYIEFGRGYDLQVLQASGDLWLNVLHLHGENIFFDQFVDYPIAVINWHDQDTPPSLVGGKSLFGGVVCGGLKREATMVLGSPEEVFTEARQAIELTGGERLILGTGCVTPITTPRANLLAARASVED